MDDVPIDDVMRENFLSKAQQPSGTTLTTSDLQLTIGRTKLTGKGLDIILESQCSKLVLVEGSFTDEDLTDQQLFNRVQQLHIRSSQLTGRLLSKLHALPNCLVLTGPAFSDADLDYIQRVRGHNDIFILNGCNVTDRCLPILEFLEPAFIDLTYTKVTSQGLLDAEFPRTQFITNLEQFTTDEFFRLKSKLNTFDDLIFLRPLDH